VSVQPVAPGHGERVVVEHSILIVDTSGSVTDGFPDEKALVQSLVAAMPAGKYEAGAINFGGWKRKNQALGTFDRTALGSYASDLTHLSEGTPIDEVFGEVGDELKGKRDHAAITVISDGLPTDVVGGKVPEQRALDAAAAAAKGYNGKVCIYTIQLGNDPDGAAFLQKLSKTTGCGSPRAASSLSSASAIQSLQREVYLGAGPTVAAEAPEGECHPPKGAPLDSRGCWVIQGLNFATNSAEIEPAGAKRLQSEVVPVLKNNPDLRIEVDGHTDSTGGAAYNQKLSERRAEAVRAFLASHGIEGNRLVARGFGATRPIAPNDTAENKRKNRRTELNVVGQ